MMLMPLPLLSSFMYIIYAYSYNSRIDRPKDLSLGDRQID